MVVALEHAHEYVIVPASFDVKVKLGVAVHVLVTVHAVNNGAVVSPPHDGGVQIVQVSQLFIVFVPQKHQSRSEHVCPSLTVVLMRSRQHR